MNKPSIHDHVEHARRVASDTAHDAQAWASDVGHALRRSDAAKWLEAGLKIGALRTGAKAVGSVARRHPVVAVATVAGIGLVWYAARRRKHQQAVLEHDAGTGAARPVEGRAKRVEARRGRSRTRAVTPSGE
ncbi:hypothetical protein H4F99_09550 [Lysobacter sp. SG-8]|uniref:Uncharacterized protein n=1 Tax=Marilutibacter penaei TaxID=2759900 RepID=A0A7W3U4G3_9GAMM|nr:hypothetical protein [Lysobacter penaei]MBB1088734.1 hypothetical protein [Lysobacter penaei]